MSDSTNQPPPGEGGTSREGENADAVEPPPETTGGGSLLRLNLPLLSDWVSGQQERVFAWLDDTLSRQSSGADPFYLKTALPVLDRLAGIGAGLIAMIRVEDPLGVSQFTPGTTSRQDVMALLGPPSQVISLEEGTVLYYLYEKAFQAFDLGYASAIAAPLEVISLPCTPCINAVTTGTRASRPAKPPSRSA